MPSHKALKSISHNFSHSFISLMNYLGDDYFLGHLLKEMRNNDLSRLQIDILHNNAEPKALLTKPILDSIAYWNKWFPELVVSSGSSMSFVNSATMIIIFDLRNTRPYPNNSKFTENSFTCEMIIIDDRGKEYRHTHSGWWFPET